ncbi:CocE/NonD family hydrolase [Geothrix sp. PMB-07]|uniref:CocE/NonD family hydrolase n=1 Tax=Geothrix sp. PMB-07 TaxID=3068640 RepID=UPI00274232BC|nr:CocE/NonD family hydrolase [Geothrix sp. PMB-07]WLT33385.1 CocE/NonD family hydrolase [Geothrix sp. PMB-07]
MFVQRFLPVPLACFILGAQAPEPPEPVQVRYQKREVMVPMRDGVKLFTSIYEPKDTTRPHPILMSRTPYGAGPYGPDAYRRGVGPSPAFAKEDYIVVYQDVRGRSHSEGQFVDTRPFNPAKGPRDTDEATDTYDTIAWLLANVPNHNGRVGQWGISYPGHYAAQALLSGHPALKAVSPQAPMIDLWEGDDSYHRGAFQLLANAEFFTFFHSRPAAAPTQPPATAPPVAPPAQRPPDDYRWFLEAGSVQAVFPKMNQPAEPIWEEYVRHNTYDAYWQARDLRPHLKQVQPAVLTVGGWFDAEDLFGALACARTLAQQSPSTASHLVMGPWSHGLWARGEGDRLGPLEFGAKTSAWFQRDVELRFFNQHLKGEAGQPLPKATMFETGKNQWRSFDTWPPRTVKPRTFYFGAQGLLTAARPRAASAFDAFISDPARPVPHTQEITSGFSPSYMTEDQRFASRRPDVLVYETAPLEADLTLAGPLRPVLQVSTTGTDSDWVVKVIDVYPDDTPDPKDPPSGWHAGGAEMLVRGDILRGKFRNSYQTPEPFVPGRPTEVAFTLPDIFHTFQKGHRLMVQIQCSWFPLADRNPQTFCDIPKAPPEAFQKAEQRVYRSEALPSRLEVQVLE